ncbi:hypothetical protein P8452_52598 [Trifolium repens]|nr:hypothetical protein P8452_52598 [Trifolium repens]
MNPKPKHSLTLNLNLTNRFCLLGRSEILLPFSCIQVTVVQQHLASCSHTRVTRNHSCATSKRVYYYIVTLRINVRSRAWGAAICCSYRNERCCIVKKGGPQLREDRDIHFKICLKSQFLILPPHKIVGVCWVKK